MPKCPGWASNKSKRNLDTSMGQKHFRHFWLVVGRRWQLMPMRLPPITRGRWVSWLSWNFYELFTNHTIFFVHISFFFNASKRLTSLLTLMGQPAVCHVVYLSVYLDIDLKNSILLINCIALNMILFLTFVKCIKLCAVFSKIALVLECVLHSTHPVFFLFVSLSACQNFIAECGCFWQSLPWFFFIILIFFYQHRKMTQYSPAQFHITLYYRVLRRLSVIYLLLQMGDFSAWDWWKDR